MKFFKKKIKNLEELKELYKNTKLYCAHELIAANETKNSEDSQAHFNNVLDAFFLFVESYRFNMKDPQCSLFVNTVEELKENKKRYEERDIIFSNLEYYLKKQKQLIAKILGTKY